MKPIKIILFIFVFSFCSLLQTYNYEFNIDDEINIYDGKLSINTTESSFLTDSINLNIQMFPNSPDEINYYVLTFDMKFREDYESDFDGVCIGPTWEMNKPGELKIILNKENNLIKTQKLDATNKKGVEEFCSSIDSVDVLFHAVGFVHHGTLLECDDEEFYRSVNVNVYSAYLMSYNLVPQMLEKGKGNIIIVSSAASNVKGVENRFIYGATKAALNGFVKAVAADYVKKGIRCNAILPGTVETPSWEGRVNMAADPKKAREDFIARQAMGRLAQPEEIASLATYLASDESSFVTGTLNLIDGGWTL